MKTRRIPEPALGEQMGTTLEGVALALENKIIHDQTRAGMELSNEERRIKFLSLQSAKVHPEIGWGKVM